MFHPEREIHNLDSIGCFPVIDLMFDRFNHKTEDFILFDLTIWVRKIEQKS